MSVWDLYAEDFPHGTPTGYAKGCKGGNCPAGLDHGLSCSKAQRLAAGDYRYRKLAGAGMSPAEIAKALDEQPIVHEAPKPRVVVPDENDIEIEGEEPIMTTTTAPAPATIIKSAKPEPQPVQWPEEAPVQGDAKLSGNFETFEKPARAHRPNPEAERIREWAREHDITVGSRGKIQDRIVEAFHADDPKLAAAPVRVKRADKPLPEHGTDARYQRGCKDEQDCLGDPVTGRTCLDAHREKIRESARKQRDAVKSKKPTSTPKKPTKPRPKKAPADVTAEDVAVATAEALGLDTDQVQQVREQMLLAEARASVALDGETIALDGPVTVGEPLPRPHQTQERENEPTAPTDEGEASEAVTEAHAAESTATDLAQFIANTEVAIAQSKQATAETALEFALKAWARERVRAEQAERDIRNWRASARMFHDLWETAETVVTADVEIIASLDTLILEQAATIDRLSRPWWKRGAA